MTLKFGVSHLSRKQRDWLNAKITALGYSGGFTIHTNPIDVFEVCGDRLLIKAVINLIELID